jgi:hypothetical protein
MDFLLSAIVGLVVGGVVVGLSARKMLRDAKEGRRIEVAKWSLLAKRLEDDYRKFRQETAEVREKLELEASALKADHVALVAVHRDTVCAHENAVAENESLRRQIADISDRIFGLGVNEFERGNHSAARLHFESYLRTTSRHELINRPLDAETFGKATTDDEIAALLDQKLKSSGRPHFLAQYAHPGADVAGLRALLCFSKYINNDDRFMSNDMIDHFHATALQAGIDAEVFATDDCSYPGLATRPINRSAGRLAQLRERVMRLRPDVVFFDAQYIGDHTTISPRFLADLRRESGVHVVGMLADAWQPSSVALADHWLPAVDSLYHFAPESPIAAHSEKIVWAGFPVNIERFRPGDEKTIDVSYSGTGHTGMRLYWLSVVAEAARQYGMNSSLHVHSRLKQEAGTIDDYAATMRRSRIVINLTRRYDGSFGVTGRVWQGLHCGALVLEEHTPLTEAYFNPYVHYVPFRSGAELERLLRFFHEHPDRAERIGKAAAAFVASEYSTKRVWGDILRGSPAFRASGQVREEMPLAGRGGSSSADR